MKVLVLGSTGTTGALVTAAAQKAGHEVTVLVRDPAKLASTAGLTVITGDATSPADLDKALVDQAGLLVALGGDSPKSDLASTAAAAFVPAAQKAGTRRVVVMSNFGVGDTLAQASLPQRLLYNSAMKSLLADKAIGDATLRASDLDWTLVYAVALANDPATGTIRVGETLPMKGMPRVNRADVANFMVAALASDEWSRRTAILSN